MSVFVLSHKSGDSETSMSRGESSEDFCTNSQICLSEQRFTLMRNTMEPLQIEQFTEGLYGFRRGFSNRKQNVGNHWKHWV